MVTVTVRCENNKNKQYSGHIWLEPIESITEHNGKTVTQPLDRAVLKEGDAVKVRWGKNKKLWNGVIAFLQEKEPPVSMSELGKLPEQKGKGKARSEEQPKLKKAKKIGRFEPT